MDLEALKTQAGGDHYLALDPQQIEVSMAWGLNPMESNCLKYLARWPYKGEELKDLDKLIDYATKLRAWAEFQLRKYGDIPPRGGRGWGTGAGSLRVASDTDE